MSENKTLVKFNAARRALAEARSIDEVKDVRDKAEALRLYTVQQRAGLVMQNDIAEIKIRAERRIGELLQEREKAKGTRGQFLGRDSSGSPVTGPPEEKVSTLADLGISKNQSSNWQAIADLPEETFERHITETKTAGDELTSAATVRVAKRQILKEEKEQTIANELRKPPSERQYHTIVIDPPWPVQKILRGKFPKQDKFPYRTMTLDEIAKLSISDLANPEGCHIYLWVTQKFLPDGLRFFVDWGIKYQCLMTWVKPTGFTPFSWMYNTEHVLFGRIGSLALERNGLKLSFLAPTTKHSEKPDVFYERVIQASPAPRLELFARKEREGFDAWGDEV